MLLLLISGSPCIAESLTGNEKPSVQSQLEKRSEPITLSPFSNLGNNLINSFVGGTTLLHLGAAAVTVVMVEEDWDYIIYRRLNHWQKYRGYFVPTIYTGASIWLVISAPLLFYGYFEKSTEATGAAYAILQSTLISITYATILKGLIGRPMPEGKWYTDMRRQSKIFRGGFLRGGVFEGWPGGHTMITTATFASLMSYYPDKWWIKLVGILFVAYTTVGMSVTKGHWMSDNIAGLLMGYAIGSTVGKSFRSLVNRKLGITGGEVAFDPYFNLAGGGISFTFYY